MCSILALHPVQAGRSQVPIELGLLILDLLDVVHERGLAEETIDQVKGLEWPLGQQIVLDRSRPPSRTDHASPTTRSRWASASTREYTVRRSRGDPNRREGSKAFLRTSRSKLS